MRIRSLSLISITLLFELTASAGFASDHIPDDGLSGWLSIGEIIEYVEGYQDFLSEIEADRNLPINIATADVDDLESIPWISPLVARKIVELRSKGSLNSLDDLRKIEDLSPEVLDLIRPFVTFERPGKSGSRLRIRSGLRLLGQVPVDDISDLGCYLRTQVRAGSARWGLTVEKDRGEKRLNDFQSGFVEFVKPKFKTIVGDYNLSLGYGLVLAGTYGASPEIFNINRNTSADFALKPHTGVDENCHLRGIGLSVIMGRLQLLSAFSSKQIDARLDRSGRIESLIYAGRHVTKAELSARKRVRKDLGAIAIGIGQAKLRINGVISYSRFNHKFAESTNYAPMGNEIISCGTNLWIDFEDFVTFGEFASSQHGDPAWLFGSAVLKKGAQMTLIVRNYPRTYLAPNRRPFSFYSDISDGESGVFCLIRLKPKDSLTMTFSNDLHRRAGIGDEVRSSGSQSLLGLKIDCKDISIEVGSKLTTSENVFDSSQPRQSRRLRTFLALFCRPQKTLDINLRLERIQSFTYRSCPKRSHAEVLKVDVERNWKRLGIEGGFYVFDVDDYDSRIYLVEPGLPYYPVITLLNRDGARWYIRLRVARPKGNNLSMKVASTTGPGSRSRKEILCYYGIATD